MRQTLPAELGPSPISTLALVFLVHSLTCAGLWLLFRFGDPDIERQVLGMVCFAFAFFGLNSFLGRRQKSLWLLPASITLLMILPILLPFINGLGLPLTVLIGATGLIFVIATLFEYVSNLKADKVISWLFVLSTLGFSCLLGTYCFLDTNLDIYAPIMGDLWIFLNNLFGDTIFHSAIAHILRSYGIPSTGLDGTPFLFYHIGIHRWVASCMGIFGGMPMTLLANSRDIVWIPVFLFTVTSVTHLCTRQKTSWVWSTILLIIFYFFGFRILYSSFWSESYLFSLPIFLSFLPIGLCWLEYQVVNGSHLMLKSIKLIFFTIAITVCFLAKMSTGLILLIYLISCLAITKVIENFGYWFRVILVSAIVFTSCLYGLKRTFLPNYDFQLFHSYLSRPLLSIVQVVIFLITVTTIWQTLRDKRHLRTKLCVVISIIFMVGQMPGLLFDLGYGAEFYFSTAVVWLCYVITASSFLNYFPSLSDSLVTITYSPNSSKFYQFRSRILAIISILTVAYVFIVSISGVGGLATHFYRDVLVKTNDMMKRVLLSDGSPLGRDVEQDEKGSLSDKLFRFRQRLIEGKDAILKDTQLGQVKRIANGFQDRHTLIYIPPENSKFWREFDNSDPNFCWFRALSVPAVTGLPMINGVTVGVGDCPNTKFFGMHVYGDESRNLSLSRDQLCYRSKKLGFRRILIIEEDSHRVEDCR